MPPFWLSVHHPEIFQPDMQEVSSTHVYRVLQTLEEPLLVMCLERSTPCEEAQGQIRG